VWTAYNILFTKGSTNSSVKFATLMINHNETDQTLNWLIADMTATFELAPDILVIEK